MLHMQFLVQLAGFANRQRCKNPSPPPPQPHPSPLPAFRWTVWILTGNVRRFNSFSELTQKYFAAFQNEFHRRSYFRDNFLLFNVLLVLWYRCSTGYWVCLYEWEIEIENSSGEIIFLWFDHCPKSKSYAKWGITWGKRDHPKSGIILSVWSFWV